MTSFAVLTATVTVSPGTPGPLCRMLLTKSSPTSRAATSPHGCPGPSTPVYERAGDPRPLCPPRKRHGLRTAPVISATALPFPARTGPGKSPGRRAGAHGDARSTRRRASSWYTASVARPWPSVETPTVRNDRYNCAHRRRKCAHRPSQHHGRPSTMRPWTAPYDDLQRPKVTHHGPEKKRPASTRIRSQRGVFAGGGRCWVRTNVG